MTEHVEGPGPGGPAASRPEPSGPADPGAGLTRRERREAREASAKSKGSRGGSRGASPAPVDDRAARRGRAPQPDPSGRGDHAARRGSRAETSDGDHRATTRGRTARAEPSDWGARAPARGGGGGRAAKRAARTATATPPRPAWLDAPTEEMPIVGGNGGGNGTGQPTPPRAARRTAAVAVVIGLLTIPLLVVAVATVGPSLLSGGGTTKPTVKPAAGGQVQLLLRPGLTVAGIAATVAALPGHTQASFLAAANSGLIRSAYEPATTTTLEGLLFPDTYFVLPNESDASIVRRLVNRFDQIGDQMGLGATTAVTPYQTVIVASLIQQEVKIPTDGPLVAAVIYNRLRLGMPLQIDATLCYVKGGCPPVPTNADKQRVSPYNTYKVTGLPPTPIASVTMASLQAAMQPANVPYLYYVISDASGKLAFSTTLAQQNHNIALAHAKGLL